MEEKQIRKYIKLVSSTKEKMSDEEVTFNIEEDLINLWIKGIKEEHAYFYSSSKISVIKTFDYLTIRIKGSANKQMVDKEVLLFDYLRTIQGIWYIEYFDKDMVFIERIMSPGIPGYDDQDMYEIENYEDGSLKLAMKE